MTLKVMADKKDGQIVPDGQYGATLSAIRRFSNAYGERVCFEFALHGDGAEGSTVTCSCSPKLTQKSKLAEILRGLLGRELTEDELATGIDLEGLAGTDCTVLVLKTSSRTGHAYNDVRQIIRNREGMNR